MATLQQQAQALGDPTRHSIFARVAEAEQPIGVRDLLERFDLHPNAIRQHLGRLVDAELVVESRAEPTGRGRPRYVYEVHPAATGRWGTDGPYEELSRLLAEIIDTGLGPEEVGRRAAERFRVPSPSGDVVADVTAAMARQGFDPAPRHSPDGTEIVLRSCPFATAALSARTTVCSLHLGIAEGLLEGTDAVVDELVAHDPRQAGCRLHIDLDPSAGDRSPATVTFRSRAIGAPDTEPR